MLRVRLADLRVPPHRRAIEGGPDTVENLMLLCPTHHTLATQGGMLEVEQRGHKANPHNLWQGYAYGPLAVTQSTCVIDVGNGVLFAGEGAWTSVDERPLLALQIASDGRLLLSVAVHGEDGELLAQIVDNEWIAGDPQPWDIESNFRKLKMSVGPRKVALRIDATAEPILVRGHLWHNGADVRLTATDVEVGGVGFGNLGLVGAELQVDTTGEGGIRLGPHRDHYFVVSREDPMERYLECVRAWRELQGEPRSVIHLGDE